MIDSGFHGMTKIYRLMRRVDMNIDYGCCNKNLTSILQGKMQLCKCYLVLSLSSNGDHRVPKYRIKGP